MYKITKLFIILFIMLACLYNTEAHALFIQEEQARIVVENWSTKNPNPMNSAIGQVIEEIRYYQGEHYGNPGYYVVFLNPNGWVIVPADDTFEPILAFGADKLTPEQYEESFIPHLFRVDVPMQAFSLSSSQGSIKTKANIERENRWGILLNPATNMNAMAIELNKIKNDIVVEPLLSNSWEQEYLNKYVGWQVSSDDVTYPRFPFYNYYTAPYPVGCSALVMAQVMRKFEHPKGPVIGEESYYVTIDGAKKQKILWRGTGENGEYRWKIMDENPEYDSYRAGLESSDPKTPQKETREEIARLLHDAGAIIASNYTLEITLAQSDDIVIALKNNFGYDNANLLARENIIPSFKDIVNLNLIYESPIIIAGSWGVRSSDSQDISGGHAFILDGYGYESYPPNGDRTEYHHIVIGKYGADKLLSNSRMWLNMAAGGEGDWAYVVPPSGYIGASADIGMIFNIFPTVEDNRKELVGGRLWMDGVPAASVDITIKGKEDNGAEVTFNKISSDKKGTFVLPVMPSTDITSIFVKAKGTHNISLDIAPLIQSSKLKVGNTRDILNSKQ